MKRLLIAAISVFMIVSVCPNIVSASVVDTVRVYSKSMERNIAVSVIIPDKIIDKDKLPVVYLLHGYGDNNLRGYLSKTDVKGYPDKLGMIIVIPDGGTSWYFDSPVDKTIRYETFVTNELRDYVESNYPVIRDKSKRAIMGLSMGGHGALYLAMRHQDVYGAAASMSGGVDFRPFPKNWNIYKDLGNKDEFPENWNKNTVIAQVPLLTSESTLKLRFDCGTEDFFYEVNCNLHDELAKRKFPHEFTVRPGEHNWIYWNRSLRDNLLFFYDFFNNAPYLNNQDSK